MIPGGVAEYVAALKASERLKDRICCHRTLEPAPAEYGEPVRPFSPALREILAARGIARLYSHQALACSLALGGRNVASATPTASGKTLTYSLPVLERFLADPSSRALFVFPLKALAQDQLKAFERLTGSLPASARPRAAVYDGDTTAYARRKLRLDPPHVLITNPEMLHLAILPHHETWTTFLAGLNFVVVDEMHAYRGVMGSHMAHVLRRLGRVCERFGARPAHLFSSATIGNPGELAQALSGLPVEVVSRSGAPTGRRHVLFVNPLEGAARTAIMLLKAALARGLRTIVYCQSRKMTELVALWAAEKAGAMAPRISAYRSGFLPEERRDIEARMASGDLLAVISTSALELGIDIGGLDLCILAGYPGTVMSTWQRGGRVGRGGGESAVILVAGEDALDQYFMRHPEDFFDRPPEDAVVNPDNPAILARHLECAAAEYALRPHEPYLQTQAAREGVRALADQGRLLLDAEGSRIHAARKAPHRDVDLRGSGGLYHIQDARGHSIGHVDEHRAFRETHPGAVYIHRGTSFVVESLSLAERLAVASERKVDYYTRTRGQKSTEILEVREQGVAFGARVGLGRLRVTETVTGYERRSVRGGRLLNIVPLDLPPLTFETEGLWFEIGRQDQDEAERRLFHFMGGIHAVEHAAIGILPLLVMTDRNDLGGISTPLHPQLGRAAVFVYDGVPGGVGLTRQAYARRAELLERTLAAIAGCPCESGCPSCVHSPKCGSGNRPIDKIAARFLLERILRGAPEERPALEIAREDEAAEQGALPRGEVFAAVGPAAPAREEGDAAVGPDASGVIPRRDTQPGGASGPGSGRDAPRAAPPFAGSAQVPGAPRVEPPRDPGRVMVFDVETQLSAAEVGGWHKARDMRLSVGVVWDSQADDFLTFTEERAQELVETLTRADLVVGFNCLRFDYEVLRRYTSLDFSRLPTLDLLERIKARLGVRVSLDTLARATLGASKTADGLKALQWWKEGRVEEIIHYCKADVAVTRDLWRFGRDHGYVLYANKAGNVVRCPATWSEAVPDPFPDLAAPGPARRS
ncbi:putative ATP-dependent RNA helicase YfmL [Fundidesulfovibrio magnetotacticus]|uniref:Putative ATP-dependent RNA helicase YfmL n=1 Tax=Fundidesulfovibrio magnetotacticus TaxID=2730080 RepID=A0A6V8LRL2_9BACT|nr:DEAD/DEAH box helicase [Fundidesulfovibrio magnetotacticus]GFK92978.1 putative ATP-dependent RNA helicase YfmL [Fundidesulfovibrio magnetotacticus]